MYALCSSFQKVNRNKWIKVDLKITQRLFLFSRYAPLREADWWEASYALPRVLPACLNHWSCVLQTWALWPRFATVVHNQRVGQRIYYWTLYSRVELAFNTKTTGPAAYLSLSRRQCDAHRQNPGKLLSDFYLSLPERWGVPTRAIVVQGGEEKVRIQRYFRFQILRTWWVSLRNLRNFYLVKLGGGYRQLSAHAIRVTKDFSCIIYCNYKNLYELGIRRKVKYGKESLYGTCEMSRWIFPEGTGH